MNRTFKFIIITVFGFLLYAFLSTKYFSILNTEIDNIIHFRIFSYLLTYLILGVPIFIALFILQPSSNILESLGINKNLIRGIVVAFLFALPMLIGYSIFFNLNTELTLEKVFIGSVFAALFEELYFRGFLFGQVFRNTKLGFIPAILFGAVLFGLGHLHQSNDFATLIGVFLVTAIGSAIFAWLYVEWNYNLWIPIGLHFFMNLHWMLFSAGENALGGTTANIFRIITIIAAIVGTIVYKKRRKTSYGINKGNVWMRTDYNTK